MNSIHLSAKNADHIVVCNKTSSIYIMTLQGQVRLINAYFMVSFIQSLVHMVTSKCLNLPLFAPQLEAFLILQIIEYIGDSLETIAINCSFLCGLCLFFVCNCHFWLFPESYYLISL